MIWSSELSNLRRRLWELPDIWPVIQRLDLWLVNSIWSGDSNNLDLWLAFEVRTVLQDWTLKLVVSESNSGYGLRVGELVSVWKKTHTFDVISLSKSSSGAVCAHGVERLCGVPGPCTLNLGIISAHRAVWQCPSKVRILNNYRKSWSDLGH